MARKIPDPSDKGADEVIAEQVAFVALRRERSWKRMRLTARRFDALGEAREAQRESEVVEARRHRVTAAVPLTPPPGARPRQHLPSGLTVPPPSGWSDIGRCRGPFKFPA
jgi:hypothetical protein